MFRNSDEYRQHLEGLSYEELLGEDFMNEEVQVETGRRLEAIESDLVCMGYSDLLGHDRLEQLADEEIERRLAAFEEADHD